MIVWMKLQLRLVFSSLCSVIDTNSAEVDDRNKALFMECIVMHYSVDTF